MTRTSLPLIEPEPYGFLYLGIYAERPQAMPLYRRTSERRRLATRLGEVAERLTQRHDVVSVRVLRAHLVPPLPGSPRHDLVMLIRTPDVDALDGVRRCDQVRELGAQEVLVGSNAARLGETEADGGGVFLLNHFTSGGAADPVATWINLTSWYTQKLGVDNSTALRPCTDDARFGLVNYVRLPMNPLAFLLSQVLRPSFYRVVRGALRRNHMRALPGFYRMVH